MSDPQAGVPPRPEREPESESSPRSPEPIGAPSGCSATELGELRALARAGEQAFAPQAAVLAERVLRRSRSARSRGHAAARPQSFPPSSPRSWSERWSDALRRSRALRFAAAASLLAHVAAASALALWLWREPEREPDLHVSIGRSRLDEIAALRAEAEALAAPGVPAARGRAAAVDLAAPQPDAAASELLAALLEVRAAGLAEIAWPPWVLDESRAAALAPESLIERATWAELLLDRFVLANETSAALDALLADGAAERAGAAASELFLAARARAMRLGLGREAGAEASRVTAEAAAEALRAFGQRLRAALVGAGRGGETSGAAVAAWLGWSGAGR